MSSVFFRTKLGTTEQLAAVPGQPLTDVLRLQFSRGAMARSFPRTPR